MNSLHPPAGDDPWLLYRGLWYPLADFDFSPEQWSGSEVVPTDHQGPFLYRQGTFYEAGITDEARAKIEAPFMEFARAIGRSEARRVVEASRKED